MFRVYLFQLQVVLKTCFVRSDAHYTAILMAFHVLHQYLMFWCITYQRYGYKECPTREGINSDNLGLCTNV